VGRNAVGKPVQISRAAQVGKRYAAAKPAKLVAEGPERGGETVADRLRDRTR
jgi:hypothetical protein